ncbi:hypothetical protein N0A02_21060 [Paraburkholderia acidicola]|uniref:Uncharacterized protein n=1 Tax=Paraburkholderia acidicola TaxID=1912599 RepID=A0ABV1LRK4_9BURK
MTLAIDIFPDSFLWFIYFGVATCAIAAMLVILALYGLWRRLSERERGVAITTPWLPRTWWAGIVLFVFNAMLTLLSGTSNASSQSIGLPNSAVWVVIPLDAAIWIVCLICSRRSTTRS